MMEQAKPGSKTAPAEAIPLKVPVGDLRLGPKEKRYLAEVIDSNRLSYGPFSQRFPSPHATFSQRCPRKVVSSQHACL